MGNQQSKSAGHTLTCALRLVQLVIRGNTGRHIPPVRCSAFCPSVGDYAEYAPYITPWRGFRRKSADRELWIAVAARFVNRKRRAGGDPHSIIAETGRQNAPFLSPLCGALPFPAGKRQRSAHDSRTSLRPHGLIPRLPQVARRRRPHGQRCAGDGQVDGRAVPGHVVRCWGAGCCCGCGTGAGAGEALPRFNYRMHPGAQRPPTVGTSKGRSASSACPTIRATGFASPIDCANGAMRWGRFACSDQASFRACRLDKNV